MSVEPAPAFTALKQLLGSRPRDHSIERCEFCDAALASDHGHAIDLHTRRLMCACQACYLLFTSAHAAAGRYRSIPVRYRSVGQLLNATTWQALQIPVGIAFVFHNSSLGRHAAFYPGPAGATESELALDVWRDVLDASPALKDVLPDVEAVLVRCGEPLEAFVVPIDACYELVGRLRRCWKGFDGGDGARREIATFFDRLRERSAQRPAAAGAS
jgi:hypothetical protein